MRSTSRRLVIGLSLLLCGLATGCGLKSTMDLSNFRNQCSLFNTESNFNDNSGACDMISQGEICDKYSGALDQKFDDLQGCLDACRKVDDELFFFSVRTMCTDVQSRGRRLCITYCRRNYAEAPQP